MAEPFSALELHEFRSFKVMQYETYARLIATIDKLIAAGRAANKVWIATEKENQRLYEEVNKLNEGIREAIRAAALNNFGKVLTEEELDKAVEEWLDRPENKQQ